MDDEAQRDPGNAVAEPIPDWLDGLFDRFYDEIKREAQRLRRRRACARTLGLRSGGAAVKTREDA